MKAKITLLLLFIGFAANASYEPGTVLFKDGHTETGFINSFLEFKLGIPFTYEFLSLEKKLYLNDKSIKFKNSTDGKARTLTTEEIDELKLKGKDDSYIIYKNFPLKTINKKGEFEDMGIKIWLPLIKKGKINIYGFSYIEKTGGIPWTNFSFYLHKEGDNFAISPYRKISTKSEETILKSLFNYLFKDCETVYNTQLQETLKKISPAKNKEERKKSDEEYRARLKTYERESLDLIYQFNFIHDTTADLIYASEKECR